MIFTTMRKNMKWVIIIVAVAFVVTLGYGYGSLPRGASGQQVEAQTVATVDGKQISRSEFLDAYRQMVVYQESIYGPIRPTQLESVKGGVLDQLINNQVILSAARKNRISVSGAEVDKKYDEFAKQFKDPQQLEQFLATSNLTRSRVKDILKDQLVGEKLIQQVKNGAKVSNAEVAQAYEEVKARHILIKIPDGKDGDAKAKAKAESILKELQGGADFATLAKKYSEDPGSKDQGGDLGFFGRGKMDPAFEKAAFALKVGELSQPVKSQFGYHIIKVEARKEAKGAEFDKQKKDIRDKLLGQKQDEIFTNWFEGVRKESKIVIDDTQLAAYDAYRKGEFDKAIELYKKALAATPDDAYLRSSLAQAYQKKGDVDAAITELKAATEQAGSDAILQFTLADLYKQKKMTAEAVAAYEKASAADPSDFYLHMTLMGRFNDLGKKDLADKESKILTDIQKTYEENMKKAQEQQQQQQKQATDQSKEKQQQGSTPANTPTSGGKK